MDALFDMFLGKVDEDKEYYTDEMLANELAQLVSYILMDKQIISKEEFIQYKKFWKEYRNKQLIEEMKNMRGL